MESDSEESPPPDEDLEILSSDSEESAPPEGMILLTSDEVLERGLVLLGWEEERLNKRKRKETNIDQYVGIYGVHPAVTAQLLEDLQTTKVDAARIAPNQMNVHKLHWALHFLYRYPTETERESTWKKCANTIREATWFYVDKIRELKAEKIVWPKFVESDIWVMTVDGTHLVVLEPGDSDTPKDPSYFSFKHHTAGFNYEIGIHLFESKCIWLCGPNKAGDWNDGKTFRDLGLRKKLKKAKKKAIADEGYRGFPNQIVTHNSLDSEEVREFKRRARQRHEVYNGKLKRFGVLSDRFRCKNNANDVYTMAEKLQMCFEAVNVLVQYMMEHGEPLWDI